MTDAEQLEELIAGTVTIPTIPQTLFEINHIVNDPDGSAAEAAEVVAQDPAIASKVLRLANSSIYALRVPVSDIQHAVCILGLKILKNLVVQATILEQFRGKQSVSTGLNAAWLWDHSIKAATAARLIVKESPVDFGMELEEAYTGGLLHDIGKILLLTENEHGFAEAVRRSLTRQQPLFLAEKEVFGFSHADVGAVLTARWNMSERLCTAIQRHHEASEDPEEWRVATLLHIANALAHHAAAQPSPYHAIKELDEEFFDTLHWTEETAEAAVRQVRQASLADMT